MTLVYVLGRVSRVIRWQWRNHASGVRCGTTKLWGANQAVDGALLLAAACVFVAAMSAARPTYIRGGSINSRASFLVAPPPCGPLVIRPLVSRAAPAWQDDLLALPFRVYAFFVMFVQTLINVRRHSLSPLAVARGSSRPYTAVPTPSHCCPHVLCVQPEALKKGKSAGPGRGPASGFGSTNSGGGGGGGKPGGGGGGGGGGSNIRGACCAPHCSAAAPLRDRRCVRHHCHLTAPYPCVRRHGHTEGCGLPARTGPAAGPRLAPRTPRCVSAPPTATLGALACTLRVRCMYGACSSRIPSSMCTAYACTHTACMRTCICVHTACSRQQRDAAGGRLRRVEPGSSPIVRANTPISTCPFRLRPGWPTCFAR